jgi:hypothetical protein
MHLRILALLALYTLLSACQNTLPELSSLSQSSMNGATGGKWGRVTVGAGTVIGVTGGPTGYKVQSRASLNPPSAVGTTTNYKVKGTIHFQ